MQLYRIWAGAIALAFAAPVTASAAVPLVSVATAPALLVLPPETQAVTYQFECPPSSGLDVEGNGGTIVLQRVDASKIDITVTTPGNAEPIAYKGTIQDDGTISIGVVREWLTALNEVIAMSRPVSATPSVGQGWNSSTILSSRTGEASVEVPLRVLVSATMVSATGRDVQLMAAGGLHATVHDQTSLAAPRVALYLRIAGHFLNGMLRDAAGSLAGSMVNGVASKDPRASNDAIGNTVSGGANSGQMTWTLTVVAPNVTQ